MQKSRYHFCKSYHEPMSMGASPLYGIRLEVRFIYWLTRQTVFYVIRNFNWNAFSSVFVIGPLVYWFIDIKIAVINLRIILKTHCRCGNSIWPHQLVSPHIEWVNIWLFFSRYENTMQSTIEWRFFEPMFTRRKQVPHSVSHAATLHQMSLFRLSKRFQWVRVRKL